MVGLVGLTHIFSQLLEDLISTLLLSLTVDHLLDIVDHDCVLVDCSLQAVQPFLMVKKLPSSGSCQDLWT